MFFSSRQKQQDRETADRLYTAIVEASRQPDFFRLFGVPDTVDGRFEMLSLHMFLGLGRLVDNGGADRDLAQRVMELFVRDMDAALREIGVSDLRVPKRMKALYGSFGGRIAGYSLAVREGGSALHEVVARNIFPDGGREGDVLAIAAYVEAAHRFVGQSDAEALRSGTVAFPDPAGFASGDRTDG
jgi:cytochrome b pre-mRNA-processing protein 3